MRKTLQLRETRADEYINFSQNKSHLFDGETVILDGKIWQFCDLKDPLLAELADIEKCEARDVCDVSQSPRFPMPVVKLIMISKYRIPTVGSRIIVTLK